jgi:hypothetical protein
VGGVEEETRDENERRGEERRGEGETILSMANLLICSVHSCSVFLILLSV